MIRWVVAVGFVVGCSAGAEDDADGAPDFMGTPPGAAGASSATGNGAGGTSGLGPAAGQGGSMQAAAGSAPVGSAGEGNGNVGPLQPGNGGSGNGAVAGAGGANATPTPAGGAAGAPANNPDPIGPGGPFVSVPVNGGASAAFVCPDGAFGDPLAGMGAVTSVAAPAQSFFAFIEGPVWVGSLGRLFFSDNASGPERIWQLEAPFTTPSIFMPDSGSNGLAIDNQDRLLLADQSDRRITRVDSSSAQVLGDVLPAGNHTPNDLIMRSDDNVYFTDPNSSGRGLYRLSPTGALSGPFTQANAPNAPNAPNGVVLSPDENTLYVGDVQARFVASFDLLADGAIDTASGSMFVQTQGNTVDGMAVDCAGNVYVGTQTGVEVFAPDGAPLGTVPTGESSNATFGGPDRRTLFVTSRSVLKLVTLGVPGLPD